MQGCTNYTGINILNTVGLVLIASIRKLHNNSTLYAAASTRAIIEFAMYIGKKRKTQSLNHAFKTGPTVIGLGFENKNNQPIHDLRTHRSRLGDLCKYNCLIPGGGVWVH